MKFVRMIGIMVALIGGLSIPLRTNAAPPQTGRGDTSPRVMFGSNESQVVLRAGTACDGPCYMQQAEIRGWNQDGQYKTWTSTYKSAGDASLALFNWWWRPDWGVTARFYLQGGYGWRECTVKPTKPWNGFDSWLHITYTGRGTCSYYFAPGSWY
jgi:hypothetical protein